MEGIKFIVDDHNKKVAVVIDLEIHQKLLEIFTISYSLKTDRL